MSAVPARNCCSARSKARREEVTTSRCNCSLIVVCLIEIQRVVDVGKRLDDGLAVGLQQLVLPRLGEFEIAEDLAAVEDRLASRCRPCWKKAACGWNSETSAEL